MITSLILLTATAIGCFAIATSYSSQLNSSDQIIEGVIEELSTSNDNPLSLSTYLADISNLKFSVAYITEEYDLIPLHDGDSEISNSPKRAVVESALNKALNLDQSRIRAYQFSAGEYLLLYYSIEEINQTRSKNIELLIIFTALIVFISTLITLKIFRNDNELNLLVNLLRRNQQRIQEFIGDASHELRTPLTVIRGYFELLKKNKTDSNQNEVYQNRIESEIFRMQSIIDDLLFITELDDLNESDTSDSSISSQVQSMVDDLRFLQPKRKIISSIEPNLTMIIANSHLTQLLANISSNISRHTPQDSLVNIELFRFDGGIKLIIEDSGPGLPDYFYKNGIQAFQRFDKSRSRESGGSGLGMTIMEKIVKKYDGNISLTPSSYNGLKIEITFN
ncbi:MAG TPA: histidine kinase dimerization/phospho-acceptor domain-containing protein [Candidatus Nanopelagicus sp.]|nr:histidine kinase dimerization/phospho-acceptor domain-containing protein [Candidatus Nanopelagicus sp.]